ncbi:MAG TPA: porin [Chitinophagaceae bacterium]|nr:porin [Chitinophagaceae bacterium]
MLIIRRFGISAILVFIIQSVDAQFLMDMIDTSKNVGRGILDIYSHYDRLRLSGYIQPQFQLASEKGAASFEGGDFAPKSNNRFMLRRSRIRVDYIRANEDERFAMQFVFQFDATERGVYVRDVWARIFENRFKKFSLTTGVFARPFGYELNLSSADRETPERGRMSQTLMKTERDIGAMISFEPRDTKDPLRYFKLDAGIFNGQGVNASTDYDSYKDFISRLSLKPLSITDRISISAGASLLSGGIYQNSKYSYRMGTDNGVKSFVADSNINNIGNKLPRQYYGADCQLKIKHGWGATVIRGEYWWGRQTGSAFSSETPASLLPLGEAYFERNFNGAFVYLLQNIINEKHQLGLKYDWYDPNTGIAGKELENGSAHFGPADIKYSTLNMGYNHYVNENLKFMFWYAMVKNEKTRLTGYTSDLHDNIFTCRLQYKF